MKRLSSFKHTFLIIMALLMVFMLGIYIRPAEANQVAAVPTDVTMGSLGDTFNQLSGTRGSYGDVSTAVDATGALFVAFRNENEDNANENWVEIHKYAPSGASLGVWRANPPPEYKIDNNAIAYSCPDLIVVATIHSYVNSRREDGVNGKFPGIFTCSGSQAAQLTRAGGPNAYVGTVVNQTVDIDYQRIHNDTQAIVDADMHTIINNMIPKTTLALSNTHTLTEGMFDGSRGSFIVYNQLLNTSFSGALEARKVPLPSPTPHP